MAIQFIDNQPLTWNSKEITFDSCKKYNEHGCTYYANSDYLYAQFKQNPCGGDTTNKFCNPDFTNSNVEKISNGNFDSGSTGWTLTNATYDSVNNRINFSTSSNGQMAYSDSFTAFTYYKCVIEIGGNTQGNVTVYLRGQTNAWATFYSPGVYTVYIQAGSGTNELKLQTNFAYDGWVDNISVQEVGIDCTEFGVGAQDWLIINPGSIIKNSNYASNFYALFNAGSPIGGYYKISCKISGMTSGSLTLADGGNQFLTITSNGVYEIYTNISSITGTGYIGVNFSASADFNGVISNISAIEYSNYFQTILKSTDGGTDYYLSDSIEYYQDYVTIKKDLSLIDPGCYELCVYDACGIEEDTQLLNDLIFDDPGQWYINPGFGTGTISSGMLKLESAAVPLNMFAIDSVNYYPNYSTMVIKWQFTTETWGDVANVYLQDKNGNNIFLCSPTANGTFSGIVTLTNQNMLGIAIRLIVTYAGGFIKKFNKLKKYTLVMM